MRLGLQGCLERDRGVLAASTVESIAEVVIAARDDAREQDVVLCADTCHPQNDIGGVTARLGVRHVIPVLALCLAYTNSVSGRWARRRNCLA